MFEKVDKSGMIQSVKLMALKSLNKVGPMEALKVEEISLVKISFKTWRKSTKNQREHLQSLQILKLDHRFLNPK